MKRQTWMMVAAVLGLSVSAVWSQEPSPRREAGREEQAPLTAAQVEKVRQILAGFDKERLDATQARSIHEAFRQAGLRGGPAMSDAIRAAGFDPEKLRDLAPPPGRQGGRRDEPADRDTDSQAGRDRGRGARVERPEQREERRGGGGGSRYSIEQAMSDRAQLHTIAFSGLAFLTGDFGGATFLPPGKVCDFFGFQYMRDIDTAEKGHNPVFLNRVAGNVLHILNDAQKKQFEDLAAEQAPQFEKLAQMRYPLIKAFHIERDAKAPAGLSREAVMKYVGDLFAFDAELSWRRAEVFGQVAKSLTAEQKAYLGKMKFGDFSSWPEMDERGKLKRPQAGTSDFYNVAYMTYASEFFSWYAGSVEADVYFCPERHATYFGGFYMKDMPAMGKRDFDISTTVTGDSGEQFLETLTAAQRAAIEAIPTQESGAMKEIVDLRRQISVELRKLLAGGTADRAQVLALGRRYGELDGELSWRCATAFAAANRTMTAEQRAALRKLRNLEGYESAPAYIYSRPVRELPAMPDPAFLFKAPAAAPAGPTAAAPARSATSALALRSPAFTDGGALPVEFTGDGDGASPPLSWNNVPEGTRSLALIMHHDAPDKTKWYWLLYNLPADTRSLPRGATSVGTLGNNSVNGRTEYAPPRSKGPGIKRYVITLYALSEPVQPAVAPSEVSRDVLLEAMKGHFLAKAELAAVYARPEGSTETSTRPTPSN